MTWKDFRDKVEMVLQKKGIEDYQIRVDFLWFADSIKPRISAKKRKVTDGEVTHDLNSGLILK